MKHRDGLVACCRRAAAPLYALGAFALVALAGCGPIHLVARTNIPTPLITKLPIGVALFIPAEFAHYVYKEDRWNTDWEVDLGKAQNDGITRLMTAMFERVVKVDSINAGAQLGKQISAILEPSIEEYAFVTPRDAGSPFFAVSIKYRVNVYLPDGKLADSWGFTGYGTSPSEGLSSEGPLAAATALAMRDAGAKLAVEFREQAIVRGLLPEPESADTAPGPKVTSELPSASGLAGASDPAAGAGTQGDPSKQAAPSEASGSSQPPAEEPGDEAAASDPAVAAGAPPAGGAAPANGAAPEGAPAGDAASGTQAASGTDAPAAGDEPANEAATRAQPSDDAASSEEDEPSSGETGPANESGPASGEHAPATETGPQDAGPTDAPASEPPEEEPQAAAA